ncbi:hypothetical protein [Streptomyces spectabilis]|uniref:Uncharacterized protein n=1 Tax=Streptomyces spectabilis TaxID=68270 RepID=A0A5P2X533_STRST|nr:hypothetical protein [Streptomyces spectabilis]MBB5108856.1 hypothetical protein [Streptomyces spectabilis]MCI3899845.1 hypothetical protein [Streptomyces spectabilis]QEV57502.1 hypothetical protein CP982_01135 [Streptomyces spectabilis]GGV42538.1 hypothetical protein GCM10010245_66720 [Streptomyces spectabilis]
MTQVWPGTVPILAEAAELAVIPGQTFTLSGEITAQGITCDGQGCLELRPADADPQQRRMLSQSRTYQVRIYRGDRYIYTSPWLRANAVACTTKGLAVTGAPGSRD